MVDLALCSHGEKGCSSFFLLTNNLSRVTATISNESLAELLRRLCVLSAMSKRCQNLLLQIYLHFPEIVQYVTLPEGTFSSGGAAHGTKCKVSRCRPAPSNTCSCAVKRVAEDFYFFFNPLSCKKLCSNFGAFLSTRSWTCWCIAWSRCSPTRQTPSLPRAAFLTPTWPVGSWLCRTRSSSSGETRRP